MSAPAQAREASVFCVGRSRSDELFFQAIVAAKAGQMPQRKTRCRSLWTGGNYEGGREGGGAMLRRKPRPQRARPAAFCRRNIKLGWAILDKHAFSSRASTTQQHLPLLESLTSSE